MKYIVITGVSTGIGYDAAATLIQHGYHVLGSVRKPADADRLQGELGEHFTPLLFDVTDEAGVKAAAQQVQTSLNEQNLAGLINNAGIAVYGPSMHIPLDDYRRQFEVNLFGVITVTQAFLPLLGAKTSQTSEVLKTSEVSQSPGRIINISSVSGKISYPFFGPYAASKHALEAYSACLRRELLPYGVDVIIIAPGSVQTPIWEKAQAVDLSPYAHTAYGSFLTNYQSLIEDRGRNGLPVAVVSQAILRALEAPRPRTRYAVVKSWFWRWIFPRILPPRLLDRIIVNRINLELDGL